MDDKEKFEFAKNFAEWMKRSEAKPQVLSGVDYDQHYIAIQKKAAESRNTATLLQMHMTVAKAKKNNVSNFEQLAEIIGQGNLDNDTSSKLKAHPLMKLLTNPGEAVTSAEMLLPHSIEAVEQIERQIARFIAEADTHPDDKEYLTCTLMVAAHYAIYITTCLTLLQEVSEAYRKLLEKGIDK